ncbi:EAL domain-containing protein [Chromatiaceae bacterium AAb-1]|nr:EAL domain-containing protein [Chromatiaceae bacterium AAb-1]
MPANLQKKAAAIRQIIRQRLLTVIYQPVVEPAQAKVAGFEALVRFLPGAELAFTSDPLTIKELISTAEQAGLYQQLDLLVTELVLADIRQLHSLPNDIFFSVNLCPASLNYPDFVRKLMLLCAQEAILPSRLCFEITERAMLNHYARTEALPQLHALGFQFAIDDFISGYANFSVLMNPLLSTVKLDHRITDTLPDPAATGQFMHVLINLLHTLNKKIIVEGVENTEQLALLYANNYSCFQGYLFSKPLHSYQLSEFCGYFPQQCASLLAELPQLPQTSPDLITKNTTN